MGFFDLFRRKPSSSTTAPPPSGPALTADELLAALTDAHARGDSGALERLFNQYRSQIAEESLEWAVVPPDRRDDRAWCNRHIQLLGLLSEALKQTGDARLYDKLIGNVDDNPLIRWQRALEQAPKPPRSSMTRQSSRSRTF